MRATGLAFRDPSGADYWMGGLLLPGANVNIIISAVSREGVRGGRNVVGIYIVLRNMSKLC